MLWISDNQQQHVPGAADDTVQRVIFGGAKVFVNNSRILFFVVAARTAGKGS